MKVVLKQLQQCELQSSSFKFTNSVCSIETANSSDSKFSAVILNRVYNFAIDKEILKLPHSTKI